ncbi:Permease of the drug/metabolite transporter (DMT) superfamily [Halanaeroarchaeum sp. HSR-CO]|uniref:DMT family transporter n=1 Tax=Halanaeroarchaeum sp. HSR-CO TaxID=2866382 RepID=UPI00217DC437|nr:DMT family transporter [Halanaeroarchaeum sp. HSR-CO]UWG48990.1 Permease of the drug/metabolite transporter (DMT) superfamily [Halanaeroarchaeum sp. HSR-CO]
MLGPALALCFALLMGFASIFSRRGLQTGSFRALLVISLGVGSVVFLAMTAVTTGFAETPVMGVVYAGIGAIIGSVAGRSLYFLGINYLGPGKSLSVSATSPLYATVFAWLVLEETITPLVVAGTVAIVGGIVVLSKDIRTQTAEESYSNAVVLYPLVAAVMLAMAVTLRKLALDTGIAPIEAGTVNMVVGLVVVLPLFATRWRREILETDPTALRQFSIASTFMAVAFILYFVGLQITNASIFFPLVQTQPLFALAFSAALLGNLEVISRWSVVGSTIIVVGAALVVLG